MSLAVAGVLCGALFAVGVLVAVTGSPRARRVTLDARLSPYLRDTPRPSRLLSAPSSAASGVERLVREVVRDLGLRLDRVLGGSTDVRKRLDRLGGRTSLHEFRMDQVTWGLLGLVGGLALALLFSARSGRVLAVPGLALCVMGALGGVLGRDRWLSRQVAERERRMLAEFPTVAELIALAVAAGESPVGALERVVRLTKGELAHELDRTLADTRAGASIVTALESLANRTGLLPLVRFADGVAVAVERGTPLADVLRAQAVDAREAGKRALMEAGGKKEIAMLVPVVFFVLPVSILFLVFPGFYGISVVVP